MLHIHVVLTAPLATVDMHLADALAEIFVMTKFPKILHHCLRDHQATFATIPCIILKKNYPQFYVQHELHKK